MIRSVEASVAGLARERFLFEVRGQMALQVFHSGQGLVAYSAHVELVFPVGEFVTIDVGLSGVAFAAVSALEERT